jgi:hypothetical protein
MELSANHYTPECGTLAGLRRAHALAFAASKGWGHLLGRSGEISRCFAEGLSAEQIAAKLRAGWTAHMVCCWQAQPWNALRVTEARVLTVLADAGPLPRPEVVQAAGGHPGRSWHSCGASWFGLLRRKGLVICQRRGSRKAPAVYALADGVRRHTEHGGLTSLNRTLRDLGLTG